MCCIISGLHVMGYNIQNSVVAGYPSEILLFFFKFFGVFFGFLRTFEIASETIEIALRRRFAELSRTELNESSADDVIISGAAVMSKK